MFSRLINILRPSTPSVLLVIGELRSTMRILHLIPESGIYERFSLQTPSSANSFHYNGAIEQTRQQIGTVTLNVGDGETADSFLDHIETRIRKLHLAQLQIGTAGVTQLVQDVLQPAVTDALHERETQERSMNATQTYPVFIIYIERSRAGPIVREPTSLPH